jgi:hypothetical protein
VIAELLQCSRNFMLSFYLPHDDDIFSGNYGSNPKCSLYQTHFEANGACYADHDMSSISTLTIHALRDKAFLLEKLCYECPFYII